MTKCDMFNKIKKKNLEKYMVLKLTLTWFISHEDYINSDNDHDNEDGVKSGAEVVLAIK